MTTQPLLISSDELCRRAKVTYRQLDSWTRRGYITPHIGARGYGYPRKWWEWQVGEVCYLALTSVGRGTKGQRK